MPIKVEDKREYKISTVDHDHEKIIRKNQHDELTRNPTKQNVVIIHLLQEMS